MSDPNRIILPINPQTNVRSTQGDIVLFRIPLECLKGRGGKGCAAYHRNAPGNFKKFKIVNKTTGKVRVHVGLCPHTLSKTYRDRRRRLERYSQYKIDVLTLARHHGFPTLPTCGWSVYFYIPMPVRWSKAKRIAMAGQLHLQTPDWDNFAKSFQDSMAITDEQVGQISGAGSFWIDAPKGKGYIEILLNQPVHNPFGVVFIDQAKYYRPKELVRHEREARVVRKKVKIKKRRRRKLKQSVLFALEDKLK